MFGGLEGRGWQACRAQADDPGGQPNSCFLQSVILVAQRIAVLNDHRSAVHLGMHYVKRNRAPDSWKAIVMMGSIGMYSSFGPLSCQRH